MSELLLKAVFSAEAEVTPAPRPPATEPDEQEE